MLTDYATDFSRVQNKIKTSTVPVGNSQKIGNVYLVSDPNFKTVNAVYLKSIPRQ